MGIALLAAALTGPFVYFAFVPTERRKRAAAEGLATGLRAELTATRVQFAATRLKAQADIEGAWKKVYELEEELYGKTVRITVPEIPKRARIDTLVSK